MKPSFALSLSFEGIRLLYRAAGGWRVVGDVALDAADLAGELEMLRKTASSLEPGGVRSKLLLPNDQIKYLTIDTPGLDDSARREAAAHALEGATPYGVDELAFDISAQGEQTHVAAVARDTLAEAEAFASEYRFNPVSFAAIPDDQPYLGEPYFGTTAGVNDLLGPGETVEPDGIAVVVIGEIEMPAGPVVPLEVVAPAQPLAPDGAVSQEAESDSTTAAPAQIELALDPDAPAPAEEVSPAAPPEEAVRPAAVEAAPVPLAPNPVVADPVVPAPTADAPTADAQATPAPVARRDIKFATRRRAHSGAAPELGGANREALPANERSLSARRKDLFPQEPDGQIVPDSSSLVAPPPRKASLFSRLMAKRKPAAPLKKIRAAAAAPAQSDTSEQERMTIFGARKSQVGGKPRFLGLVLTAALLMFLAGVAAWASVFLDDTISLSRLFGDRGTKFSTVQPDVAPILQPKVQAEAESPAPKIIASLEPGLTAEDNAVLDALREPVQPSPPAEPTEAELAAYYATSGIWYRAPEVPPDPAGLIDLENLYLTSIDPISTANDAIALPQVDDYLTDTAFAALSSPAAAGTKFTLDANGMVVPTPEGALSPDGFTVYLGRPEITPPAVLTRFASEPVDTAVRSALAAFRPEPRPGDLVERTERAQLDGLTLSELASYRPALRPRSLQEKAVAETAPAAPSDASVAGVVGPPPPFDGETKFAVRASIRPDVRPNNFARIVKRAEQEKPKQDAVRVANAGAIAPRVVKPKIPSKTSVAKQATVKNAINLREVNLIGVYGKPSSRRALVRLSNGRYQKVVVGDRIDGGRVSAIGDNELRYTKRGRDHVLKMPR